MFTRFLIVLTLGLAGCAGLKPEPVVQIKKPPIIGLALGGGAARGFAHIGVISVLQEAGIKPDLVVGTSAGSLVGALYASGKTPAQLVQVAMAMDESSISDWTLPLFGNGVLRGDALAKYVNEQVAGRPLESLAMPFGAVATDVRSGQAVLFRRGDTGLAVRASCAVPAVFSPVRIRGQDYVDGGLVSPVPVQFARQMGAQLIIGVDISSPPDPNLVTDVFQVFMQTFSIMGKSINGHELKDAEIVVRPNLTGMKSTDFSTRQRSIDAGRAAMLAALPALKAKIESMSTLVPVTTNASGQVSK